MEGITLFFGHMAECIVSVTVRNITGAHVPDEHFFRPAPNFLLSRINFKTDFPQNARYKRPERQTIGFLRVPKLYSEVGLLSKIRCIPSYDFLQSELGNSFFSKLYCTKEGPETSHGNGSGRENGF